MLNLKEKQDDNEIIPKEHKIRDETKKLKKENDKKTIKNNQYKINLILNNISEDLNRKNYDNIEQVIESYQPYEKITKKVINPNLSIPLSNFMFYIILPLFNILYLVAIFKILSIMKIIFKIFKNSIKFRLILSESEPTFSIEEFNKNYNFFSIFVDENKKDSFDFNLIFITGWIGKNCMKSRGFRKSALIYFVINTIILIAIFCSSLLSYGEQYNIDNIITIFVLFLLWFVLFITVGASALLSLQISTDKIIKLDEYSKKIEEESKINEENKILMNSNIENNDGLNDEIILIDNDINQDNLEDTERNEGEEINDESRNQNIEENYLKIFRDNINDIPEKIIRSKTSDSDNIDNFNEKNFKTNIKIKKNGKKNNSQLKYFLFNCTTIVFAYIIDDFINLIIMKSKNDKINEYMDNVGCTHDTTCYENIIKDKNLSITNRQLFNELINKEIKDDSLSFIIIIVIYLLCQILSFLLYSLFTNKVFTQDGSQQIEKDNEINSNKTCCILNISQGSLCNCGCTSCCCSTFKILVNILYLIINSLINCICQPFNCTNEMESKDYFHYNTEDEEEEIEEQKYVSVSFKIKSFLNYIIEFITSDIQKMLTINLFQYLLLQLTALGFGKQYLKMKNKEEIYVYQNKLKEIKLRNEVKFILLSGKNEHKENNNILKTIGNSLESERFTTIITIILSFYLFLYFSISYKNMRKIFQIKNNSISTEKKENRFTNIINISIEIESILIFNGIYSLIFSLLYHYNFNFDSFPFIKELYLIPILMYKFYNFTLIYLCVGYSEEMQRIELIKGSAWISIFLFLWDLLNDYLITSYDIEFLYIIQTISSVISCGVFIVLIVYSIVKISSFKCSKILLLFLFLLFYFSGICGFFVNEECFESFNNFFDKPFESKNPSII